MRIAHLAYGRDNNFNLLRLVAACMVIYAHAHTIAQGFVDGIPNWSGDALYDLTGMDSGRIAVQVFFIMSGFLVAQSVTRSGSLKEFFIARALRLMPALIMAVLVCVFVIGLCFTTKSASQYLVSGEVKHFLFYNLALMNNPPAQFLPGVFEQLPYDHVVNGSLWTLPWEALMYVTLAGLFAIGLLQRRLAVAIGFAAVFVAFCFSRENLLPMVKYLPLAVAFTSFFFLGVLAWLYRDRISMSGTTVTIAVVLLLASLLLFKASVLVRSAYPFLLAYSALGVALVPGGAIRGFNRMGDYSYGVYVYGFPLQQSLMALHPEYTALQVGFYGLALVLLLAVPSWHLLEKPMLSLKKYGRSRAAIGYTAARATS
ncbi:MAG TPA: acyltransferase [Nevskiaceae bacterium]|nr:acyltransferase [Nevskiaceae bacterium]